MSALSNIEADIKFKESFVLEPDLITKVDTNQRKIPATEITINEEVSTNDRDKMKSVKDFFNCLEKQSASS
jgi:hypothetical protein